MRGIRGLCLILSIGVANYAQIINISGTVKEGNGAPITGALVTLVSNTSVKDTPGATIETVSVIRGGQITSTSDVR